MPIVCTLLGIAFLYICFPHNDSIITISTLTPPSSQERPGAVDGPIYENSETVKLLKPVKLVLKSELNAVNARWQWAQ